MMPKVSVVVPCYNVEGYVEQCVRSAMEQTLREIEIICVNDGSTDSTLDILERLAEEDGRIRVIDKPNSGYGNTMNVGFDCAQGRYLAILESDDYIEPNMYEELYGVAEENNLDVVKSNFYFYWSTPKERNVHCDLLDEEECGRVLRPRDEPHVFYVKPSIWSALYRAEFIRKNEIRFNETPGASYQDASFNFQVWLCADRVQFVREAFLHYRQDNEKSSVNSPGKVYCVCDEYARMEGFLDEWPDADEARRILRVLVAMKYDTYMWNYERLTPELASEFLERFVDEMRAHIEHGDADRSDFTPEKGEELRLLLKDPDFLMARRHAVRNHRTRAGRALSYFKQGGIDYVMKPRRYRRDKE